MQLVQDRSDVAPRLARVLRKNQNPARGSGRAQFASFNFPNSLICAESSSARVQGA
jgi:hypothetical protein